MPATFLDLSKMTVNEKLDLINKIWDTITPEQPPMPVPEWLKKELDRRHEEFLRDPSQAIDWKEAKAQILNEYAKSQNPASGPA
jgi:putative addiction module component (TIGR02574 family)